MKTDKTRNIALLLSFLLVILFGCGQTPAVKDRSSAELDANEGGDIPASWKLGPAAEIEKVKFKTSDGVEIVGNYRGPSGNVSGKVPGLVLVPMLGRTKDDYNSFSQLLSEVGMASLAIDLRGHGESTMGGKLRYGRFTDTEWNECIKDVNSAIGFLKNKPDIDPEFLGLMGASIGANLVLKCSIRPEVKIAIALSPGENYKGVTIHKEIPAIKRTPVMVYACDGDKVSFDATSKIAQALNDNIETRIVPDKSLHGTEMLKIPFFPEDLIKWIKGNIDAKTHDLRTEREKDNYY